MGRKAYESFVCSCGEECTMIPHEKSGKLAPITRTEYDSGNIVLSVVGVRDGNLRQVYRVVPKAEREADPRPRLLNHWSNCPDAARFRR